MKFSWLLFFFLPLWGFAQQNPAPSFRIRGVLADGQNKAIPFGSIALYRVPDSTLVGGVASDDAGRFELPAAPGRYYLKVTMVSFQSKTIPNVLVQNQDVQLGTVALKTSAELLEEVLIRGERSQMELALDKKIFHVGKDLANAGGTAADILSNVPSVAVDVEGNVSLRGSGNVRILIDGKPSGLVSLKGGSGLQQLQGSSIERVEVITNPSARYEAEGMGGIINIVLKKERQEGFNGSFDFITGQPDNFGLGANVNYRRKNLNFFVNYTASYRNAPGRNATYQELYGPDTLISDQTMDSRLKGLNNSARAGLDYFFNDRNILTGAYTYRLSKGKRFSDIRYLDYLGDTRFLQSRTDRTQDETETEPNSEYSLSYKRTFARKGQEFTADLRFLDNWEESDQTFTEQSFRPDGQPAAPGLLQRSLNDETEKQLLVQVDYVHPFSEEGKLEAGLRSSSRDMTNNFSVSQQAGDGNWMDLDSLTNNFLYEENIHALYGILGNKVARFTYQLGLRAELTDVTTTLKKNNEVNPRDYSNLFPSGHLTYELPRDHALQLSYSRRVRRPQYNDLSPFMTYSDRRNYWSGNPDLNPEFTDAYELGHIKYFGKGSLSSTLYYRYTTDKVVRIRRLDERGFSFTRPENLATEKSFGAEFAGSYQVFPWWKADGSLNLFRARTDGRNLNADFQSDTYSWFVRQNSRLTLWKKVDFQVRGNYEAPQQTPQGRRKAMASLDLALSRDILREKGTLTLNVVDVFNSRRYRNIIEGTNAEGDRFYTESFSQPRQRQVNLTLNYRLHQAKKVKELIEGEF
ncbi:MAG: TonB-dependent receptor domain-containing protein [Adhaeribacter sp.]